MQRPILKSTNITNEPFANLIYHIEGELVPSLTVEVNPNQGILFEHHVMLWKNTNLSIGTASMKGGVKRMLAGLPLILLQASGEGQIAFSRNGAGQVIPIHLEPGQEIDVREHQYLAASSNLEYTYARVSGVSSVLFGGTGFFIDKFRATNSAGIVWLHGYGNVFEKTLEANEQIDVEPGSWLYKDPSVKMDTNIQRFTTGMMASTNFFCNRFTGPGRIGIQSMSTIIASEASGSGGGLLGKLLGN